ncbi:MAG: sigma-70 family RNA polymerase sigma factor [Gaiellaceae bacterium]
MAAVSPSRATALGPTPGAAVEALYARHAGRVLKQCRRYLSSREEAEDAAQTTFLYALRSLKRGATPAAEGAWLMTIARNVCFERYRGRARRAQLEVVSDPQSLDAAVAGPESEALTEVPLERALALLPEQQRRAWALRELRGLSYAEIAAELGVTVTAVEMLVFRARRRLAEELRGEPRRGRVIASLLTWLKPLFGGTAAKVAVTALALAGAGIATEARVQSRSPAAPAPVSSPPVLHRTGGTAHPKRPTSPRRAESTIRRVRVAATSHPAARADAKPMPQSPTVPLPPSKSAPAADNTKTPTPAILPTTTVRVTPAPSVVVPPVELPTLVPPTVPVASLPSVTVPTALPSVTVRLPLP